MRGPDEADGGDVPSLSPEAVVDAIDGVFYVVAPGERLVGWNDRLPAVTGYDDEEIAGMRTPALLPPGQRDLVPARAAEVRETGAAEFETHLLTKAGQRVPVACRERRLTDADGEPAGRCGVGRDVSDRERRKAVLRRSERRWASLFEDPSTTVCLLGPDGTVLRANETALNRLDAPERAVRGRRYWDVPWWPAVAGNRDAVREAVRRAADGETVRTGITRDDAGDRPTAVDLLVRPVRDEDGAVVSLVAEGRDATERLQRRQEIRREKAFTDTVLDAIPDLLYAFDDEGQFLRWNDEVTEVTGYDDEAVAEMDPLEFVAPGDRDRVADAIDAVIQSGTDETVEADLLTADGEHVPHEFTGARIVDARGGVHGLVGTGRDVSDRKRRERDLERQRDELRRLHRINALIRDVNRALVAADSRPAVDRALCDRLTTDDGYAFAWVGEPDLGEGRLHAREAAGDGDGYLDEVTVSFGGDDADGPAARAVRTETLQVARPIEAPAATLWCEAAARRGFGSGVAVPVTYDGTLYAVLNVYSREPDAFDERERTILSELAGTVGYALNAILHRDVLASDGAVELEFRVEGGPAELVDATRDGPGRLLFDRTVRSGDDRTLWYVTAVGMDPDRIRGFEDADVVVDVSLLSEGGDRHRIELAAEDPPLTAALASHGGRMRRMRVEDGETSVVAELPPGADLRAVRRSVREAMPDASLVAQRPSARDPESLAGVRTRVTDALTERQRAVLEAAYAAGYFERPRETTGDELAASMDVTRSTFHQHLRVATRKLVAAVFDDGRTVPD